VFNILYVVFNTIQLAQCLLYLIRAHSRSNWSSRTKWATRATRITIRCFSWTSWLDRCSRHSRRTWRTGLYWISR